MLADPKQSAEGSHVFPEGVSREADAALRQKPKISTEHVIIILDDDSDTEEKDTNVPQGLPLSPQHTQSEPPLSPASASHISQIVEVSQIPAQSEQPSILTQLEQPPQLSESNPIKSELDTTTSTSQASPEPLLLFHSQINQYFAAANNNTQAMFDSEIFDMQLTAQGAYMGSAVLRGFVHKRKRKRKPKRRI